MLDSYFEKKIIECFSHLGDWQFNGIKNTEILEETDEYTLYRVYYREYRFFVPDVETMDFKIEK